MYIYTYLNKYIHICNQTHATVSALSYHGIYSVTTYKHHQSTRKEADAQPLKDDISFAK